MKKIKDSIGEILAGIGFILLMWAIISNGMHELVGDSGLLWGALITGIVLFSVYVSTQEKNKSYNREVNMNKKNLLEKMTHKIRLIKRDIRVYRRSKQIAKSFNDNLDKDIKVS